MLELTEYEVNSFWIDNIMESIIEIYKEHKPPNMIWNISFQDLIDRMTNKKEDIVFEKSQDIMTEIDTEFDKQDEELTRYQSLSERLLEDWKFIKTFIFILILIGVCFFWQNNYNLSIADDSQSKFQYEDFEKLNKERQRELEYQAKIKNEMNLEIEKIKSKYYKKTLESKNKLIDLDKKIKWFLQY